MKTREFAFRLRDHRRRGSWAHRLLVLVSCIKRITLVWAQWRGADTAPSKSDTCCLIATFVTVPLLPRSRKVHSVTKVLFWFDWSAA